MSNNITVGLLILRVALFKITVAFQTWARLIPKSILCAVFMFAGANFSHGSELHHKSTGSKGFHHSTADQKQTENSIVPHSHFEPENLDQGLNEIAVHCGSPELQPNTEIFSHNMVFIGAVENCFKLVLAGMAFNLEPPPPRT